VKKVLGYIMKPFLKIPAIRRRYLKRVLEHLEETPASKLSPELRQVQAALKRLPKHERYKALERGLEAGPSAQQELPSRALRRMAERQSKKYR